MNDASTPKISSENLDPAIVALREKITREMDKKTLLDGVADMGKIITGPLVAIGCSTLIASIATAAGPAATLLFFCGIGLLSAGMVALTTSITASYCATKIERSTSFERGELDRMRTAHHLVEAMRQSQACIGEEKTAGHTRKWSESIEQAAAPCQSL